MTKLEEKIGYKFINKNYLKEALTHKSSKLNYNNERLEFLGDAVLDLIVGEYLYINFKNTAEGDLSKLRAALVNEKSFAKMARHIELGEFLILSVAEDNNGGREKDSLLSDAFEAIFGALYLEGGLGICKQIAVKILEESFPNINLDQLAKDYKTKLQEISQSKFGVTPTYKFISSSGPDHKKVFKMAVLLGDKEIAVASGKSKKEAEQRAADEAIKIIKEDSE